MAIDDETAAAADAAGSEGERAGDEPGDASLDDTGFDDRSFEDEPITDSSAVQRFRKNTSVGMVMNAAALGLQEIFDPTIKQDAPVVQDAPGEPPGGRFIDTDIDPYDPASSSVSITPGREHEEREGLDDRDRAE